MTVACRFLHSTPQREIASLIRECLGRCRSADIVSGFVTPDGVEALRSGAAAARIRRFVVGAGTFKAFEALDGLIDAGLAPTAVGVHLGHTRQTGGKKHPFARYRPMLHSKIYLFEMPHGAAAAFVGSHNLTGFALRGLNGEAGVLLEGPSSDPLFAEIREHVDESFQQAAPYDPSLKEAYAQWFRGYLEELATDATNMPRDDESKRTVILFAVMPSWSLPHKGQRIYFELDARLTEISTIDTEVHLHLFREMPRSPTDALACSGRSDAALIGRVEAIDAAAGSAEVNADWFIDDPSRPKLRPTIRPFRPNLSPGKQQVRAHVLGQLGSNFDYLFGSGRGRWDPNLGNQTLRDEAAGATWWPVKGFSEASQKGEPQEASRHEEPALPLLFDLREMSPASGSYVLYSRRRRKLGSRGH